MTIEKQEFKVQNSIKRKFKVSYLKNIDSISSITNYILQVYIRSKDKNDNINIDITLDVFKIFILKFSIYAILLHNLKQNKKLPYSYGNDLRKEFPNIESYNLLNIFYKSCYENVDKSSISKYSISMIIFIYNNILFLLYTYILRKNFIYIIQTYNLIKDDNKLNNYMDNIYDISNFIIKYDINSVYDEDNLYSLYNLFKEFNNDLIEELNKTSITDEIIKEITPEDLQKIMALKNTIQDNKESTQILRDIPNILEHHILYMHYYRKVSETQSKENLSNLMIEMKNSINEIYQKIGGKDNFNENEKIINENIEIILASPIHKEINNTYQFIKNYNKENN